VDGGWSSTQPSTTRGPQWKEPTHTPAAAPSGRCPNCCKPHTGADACLLGLLLGTLEKRLAGERDLTNSDIDAIFAAVDPDALWDRFGGPGVDYLESLLPAPTAAPA
jgi:hypothetical protein